MSTPGLPPDSPSGQPIPGVRYRVERRERLVPQTVNGETRMVPEAYDLSVPVPPRDWDRVVLRAVTAAASAVTGVSLGWTIAVIGALLAPAAPDVIAYGAAALFDLAWVTCQAAEWLERHDQDRAKVARGAGSIALVIAVGAIVAHGITSGRPIAGAVGAAVSVIAKGLWVVVLRHYAVPLGPRVGGWLLQRRREVAAQRALAGELRRLGAEEAYAAAVFGAAADSAREAISVEPLAPAAHPTPSAPGVPPAMPSGSVVPPPPDSPVGQGARDLRPVGPPTISQIIRDALKTDPEIENPDLVERAREVHGDSPRLAETVARTRRRIESPPPHAKKRSAS